MFMSVKIRIVPCLEFKPSGKLKVFGWQINEQLVSVNSLGP